MDLLRIVAIGGGDMGAGETLPLDQLVVELTGKQNPKALFIPTASFDDPDYAEMFRLIYGESLGCEVDNLLLWEGYSRETVEQVIGETRWDEAPHKWEIRFDIDRAKQKIAEADLIYVGGGNTKRLLELWRSAGLDQEIISAGMTGTVLAGLSAGCICWGRFGNSDYALTEELGYNTGRVEGLDLIPLALCPHTSREGFRLDEFARMMEDTPGVGLGLDDGCALVISGNKFRIATCIEGALAHKLYKTEARVQRVEIAPSTDFKPIGSLLEAVS